MPIRPSSDGVSLACNWGQLGLPTLAECSSASWTVGSLITVPTAKTRLDFWSNRTSSRYARALDPWADNYFYQQLAPASPTTSS